MKLVFLGDSMTAMSRERAEAGTPAALGAGFVFLIAAELGKRDPLGYSVLNRGVSGDHIYEMYARLPKDVFLERPDVLTIMIGAEDAPYSANPLACNKERFEKLYRLVLDEVREALPNCRIILMTPFSAQYPDEPTLYARMETYPWYAELAGQLAKDYGCEAIILQELFDGPIKQFGRAAFSPDGTNPSPAASRMIADEWLRIFDSKEAK